jgi:hypothetical protein
LAIGTIVPLVLALFLTGITRETSPDAFIPKDHPALARKKLADDAFGLKEPLVVGIFRDAPGGVFTPSTLRLIRDLSRAIQQLPGIEPDGVLSLATESGVYLDERSEPSFDLLMKEIPETPEGLDSLQRDVLGYELYRGTLVSRDGSAACIVIRPRGQEMDDQLYRQLVKLVRGFPVTDERVVVAGEAAVRAHMGVAVSDDGLRMNLICPLVMALLILLAYRTARGTLIPLGIVGASAMVALGLMAAFRVPIYIVTNGIFVVIIAVGVGDALNILGQYYEQQLDPRGRTKQQIIVDAAAAVSFPVLGASLTDLVGFFALYLVGTLPPIRYFGLFVCVGSLTALIYSYTVVPAALMIRPLAQSKAFLRRTAFSAGPESLDGIGRTLGRVGAFVFRNRRLVLVLSSAVVAVACWGASYLRVNDARILAFKPNHPIAQATKAINERFDGTSHLNIVVTATHQGAMLQADMLRRIADLEAFTETLPFVGGTHSPAGWVKRAHQKANHDDPAFYKIPEDESDTKFYLDVLSNPNSPMARMLREVTDETYTRANLTVRMKSSESVHEREVIRRLQRYIDRTFNDSLATAFLTGRVDLDYHWLEIVRSSHIKGVVFSFVVVVLLVIIMFRSFLAGLLCGLVVGVVLVVNYAVMGLSNIPLGVGTSMFASIAIGISVNFPIYLLDRLRASLRPGGRDPEEVFRSTFAFTGRAFFFTTAVVTGGFLLLCVSQFTPLIYFGLLVGLAMAVSFITSITLLPAVVAMMKPRFIWPATSERSSGKLPTRGSARADETVAD